MLSITVAVRCDMRTVCCCSRTGISVLKPSREIAYEDLIRVFFLSGQMN